MHFLFSVFFCITSLFQIHPSEKQLSYLCSDACKDIRKNQIYPHLFQKDFSVLTKVNRYLYNEIGHISYIDFKKLEKHVRNASLSACVKEKKTIHLCCVPNPYLSNLKNEICHFMEAKIIPSAWSFGKSCFLHEYEQINTKCPGHVFDGSIYYLDGHNYITLISNNGTDSEEISTISLDNEVGRLEYIRFLHGHETQLSQWPIDYSRKHCAMILYIIDHLNQSFESLDHYINDTKDAPLMIILSSELQNNEQIRQKLHDKIGEEIAYKCEYYNKVRYHCNSCEKEPGVKWLYPDLFPHFSLPNEKTVKEGPATNPICHTIEEPTHLETEKEKLKENDVPTIVENQSVEPTNTGTPKTSKITHSLCEFLKNNSKIITLSSLGLGGIIMAWLLYCHAHHNQTTCR